MIKERFRFLWRAWRYRWLLDTAEIRAIRERLKPGDLAIDIGVHKGAYSYWMAKSVGPTGKVAGFEPQRELADYVKKLAGLSGLDQISVENAALSSAAGKVTIVNPDGKGPSPGARISTETPAEGMHAYEIDGHTLDEFFASEPKRPARFIKCDVEGHELEVFQGGQQLLSADKPAILFECEVRHRSSGTVIEVFEFLESLGYEGRFFSPDGLRPVSEFDASKHQSADPRSNEYLNNFLFEVPISA
ncbi:MAG: FkbM family methyltransferase [Verrucomicrobiales bacterium]|jgi:FkbM family methyltransferase